MTPKVVAIIPAHSEEKFIGSVVRAVLAHVQTVIVVDDGSPDQTAEAASSAGATIVKHEVNRGKGAAIQTGLQHPLSQAAEYFLLMDADGQHDPAEIPNFLCAATASRAKLIIGNRMNDLSRMPLIRRWTNRFMSWQISLICGQSLPDSQCGYRLVHRDLLPLLLASSSGFDFETEILLLSARKGFKIEFVAIRTIYRNEQSKIKPVRDTLRYLRLISRYIGK